MHNAIRAPCPGNALTLERRHYAATIGPNARRQHPRIRPFAPGIKSCYQSVMFIVAANPRRCVRKSTNKHGVAGARGLFVSTTLALAVLLSFGAAALQAADALPKVAKPKGNIPVTVTDDGGAWTLDNGIVKATINKNNSNMPSLVYNGINTKGPG